MKMKNKNILIVIGIIVVVVLIIAAMFITPSEKTVTYEEELLGVNYDVEGNETTLDNYDTENPVVAMYIENYGTIIMELYPDVAPNTVNNFISLIKSGFYDNNSFHRLVPGFVLQGGDPDGNGTGGPGYSIKGEFTSNGFENNLKHEKGIVSMARSSDNDSAGSQFFIMLDASSYLDGSYAAFGKVIDGFDIIEKIEDNEKVSDSSSGKLQTNLVIKKTLVDLKGKEYAEVEKIEE
jgi:peptidyl-prolyl cis-trans isomerase B (cyclophilin B)